MSDGTTQFKMESASRDVTNPITKQVESVTYQYAVATTLEEAEALCGSTERILEIVNSRNKGRFGSYFSDARVKGIETVEAWQKHLQSALESAADTKAPLASTRGTGVNAKAKEFDTLTTELASADSPEAILAILRARGYAKV